MRKRELLSPDLTPLIDVVFILLIFFIVSSVFKKNELALVLNLPKSQAQEIKIKPKEVIIELNVQSLALYGKITNLKDFEEDIINIKNKEDVVLFKIDKDVKYNKVVKILDILQKNKLFNISLITQKKE